MYILHRLENDEAHFLTFTFWGSKNAKVTEIVIGKSIFSAQENRIKTLRGVDGPTIHLRIADDIGTVLRGSMKIAETARITQDEEILRQRQWLRSQM